MRPGEGRVATAVEQKENWTRLLRLLGAIDAEGAMLIHRDVLLLRKEFVPHARLVVANARLLERVPVISQIG